MLSNKQRQRVSRSGNRSVPGPRRKKIINQLIERKLMEKVSFEAYRDKVRDVYDGPQGAMLAACSAISGHMMLGERLFRSRKFDLAGSRKILDVGSGAGQIAKHLLKYADPDASLTCFDLSQEMLRRARNRLKSERPRFVAADLTQLPFADESFDCITCGYVLEHVPDPRQGLMELSRVLQPGGRFLLLATEDTFSGAWTSLLWCCQTYNRRELKKTCEEVGLEWHEELWFTRIHKLMRAGGICAVLVKR